MIDTTKLRYLLTGHLMLITITFACTIGNLGQIRELQKEIVELKSKVEQLEGGQP